jgi:hypothetical protein
MQVFVSDTQVVGETEGTLFEILQQGTTSALVILENTGDNIIGYNFESLVGSTWTDLDESGTDLYNTLTVGEVKAIKVESDDSRVRMRGNASGGSELTFSILRNHTRSSGAAIPILSL